MKAADIPEFYREMLCLHEAFRRMGFSSEEIHVNYYNGEVSMGVTRGGLESHVRIGQAHESKKTFKELWRSYANWMNTAATEQELQEMWESSRAKEQGANILFKLAALGFMDKPGVAIRQ